jgi:hypothetical protein
MAHVAQKSLGALGIDTSLAVERARSQSRGRKRERSLSKARSDAAGGEGDQEMADCTAKKRIHSSKSRWVQGLVHRVQGLGSDCNVKGTLECTVPPHSLLES